jgi:hypothetical protein
MLTLNQLKYKLIGFFESHAQINTVKYLSDDDFKQERHILYPAVNIEYINSNISERLMNHNYLIKICDITEAGNTEMKDEIISDSIMITEDFYTWLQNNFDFTFSKSSSMQHFEDNGDDRTAGIVFGINVTTTRLQNSCSKPMRI